MCAYTDLGVNMCHNYVWAEKNVSLSYCCMCVCVCVSPREAVSADCVVGVCAVLDLVSVKSAAVLAQCARVRTPVFLKPPKVTHATYCRHTYSITTVLTAHTHTNVLSNMISALDTSTHFLRTQLL